MTLWPGDIEATAADLIASLKAAGLMAATAESCTGGLIAGALTEISGSSAVVDRGFVTYSNEAKMDLLGVSADTLARVGAVSQETALEMVAGALKNSRADVAVAVTGIAGPGGGSPEKPVGLVHIAAGTKGGARLHREMRYGDLGRTGVRLATLSTALEMLRDVAFTT
ncbi:CinA family protein [Rhizobium sp. SG2393]|uniref:CinA family protein n=1 Tax=Rhizobium sp. SG2393 TaxID=3276279 RepID=UPI00366EA790